MKLFTLDADSRLIPYTEQSFGESYKEADLETILEESPEYFFEQNSILIIGRQITTNLKGFIDLLGLDSGGNTVAIELKRGKTPRETVAQILEYASFVEKMDYDDLNKLFQIYRGEENDLTEYHRRYFGLGPESPVSFNKSLKLIIVAQEISREIKQTALFLGAKGIDIYCIEFKYFETASGERIISSEFIVGKDDLIRPPPEPKKKPTIDRERFLRSLDDAGRAIFERLLRSADESGLLITWGSVGFSLSLPTGDGRIPFLFGYGPSSIYGQSITIKNQKLLQSPGLEDTGARLENTIRHLGNFTVAGKEDKALKWVIDKPYPASFVDGFINAIADVALMSQACDSISD